MPVTMSHLSQPAFLRGLGALAGILDKAEQHAADKGFDPAVLVQARLAPDMYPLARQVQIVSDTAKGAVARLAAMEAPSFEDSETTLAALEDRVTRTAAFIRSVTPEAIDGSEARPIEIKARTRTMSFVGQDYLLGFALPNFYFHLTTAYAILRHNGVAIGKMDYLGAGPTR